MTLQACITCRHFKPDFLDEDGDGHGSCGLDEGIIATLPANWTWCPRERLMPDIWAEVQCPRWKKVKSMPHDKSIVTVETTLDGFCLTIERLTAAQLSFIRAILEVEITDDPVKDWGFKTQDGDLRRFAIGLSREISAKEGY